MSRRKEGARSYKHYSERRMQLCLSDIENKILTQREASEQYKIPRSSIISSTKEKTECRTGKKYIFGRTEKSTRI